MPKTIAFDEDAAGSMYEKLTAIACGNSMKWYSIAFETAFKKKNIKCKVQYIF